jgi:peptide/nickel transport system substrate-binding protein
MNMARSPWQDVRVRKAVHLTLDRQAFAKVVFGGAFSINGFVAPDAWAIPRQELTQLPGYRQPKDADRAEAKQLLSAAGFPNGFETTILTQSEAGDTRKAVFIKDQLATIGIKVALDVQEAAAFYDKQTVKHDYNLLQGGYGTQIVDPTFLFQVRDRTGGNRNFSQSSFPDLDKLIDQFARESDLPKRKTIALDIQRKLYDVVPHAPSGGEATLTAGWKTVRNWIPHDGRHTFTKCQDTWLSG